MRTGTFLPLLLTYPQAWLCTWNPPGRHQVLTEWEPGQVSHSWVALLCLKVTWYGIIIGIAGVNSVGPASSLSRTVTFSTLAGSWSRTSILLFPWLGSFRVHACPSLFCVSLLDPTYFYEGLLLSRGRGPLCSLALARSHILTVSSSPNTFLLVVASDAPPETFCVNRLVFVTVLVSPQCCLHWVVLGLNSPTFHNSKYLTSPIVLL